jgi:hypothetical protein
VDFLYVIGFYLYVNKKFDRIFSFHNHTFLGVGFGSISLLHFAALN